MQTKQLHQTRLQILNSIRNSQPPTNMITAQYRYNIVQSMLALDPKLLTSREVKTACLV
jgi:hypothetical protein